jgi:hypothetical protein
LSILADSKLQPEIVASPENTLFAINPKMSNAVEAAVHLDWNRGLV